MLLLALSVPLVRSCRSHWQKLSRGIWSRVTTSLLNDSRATVHSSQMPQVGAFALAISESAPDDGTVGILMDEVPMGQAQFLLALRVLCYPREIQSYDVLTRRYAASPHKLDGRIFVLDATPHRDPFMVDEWRVANTGQLKSGLSFKLLQFQPKSEEH